MRGAVSPLPKTLSWRGAHLKRRDNFTLKKSSFTYGSNVLSAKPSYERTCHTIKRKHESHWSRTAILMCGHFNKAKLEEIRCKDLYRTRG